MMTMSVIVLHFYVYSFNTIWLVFVRYRERHDLVAATVIFSLCMCSEVSLIKLGFIAFNSDKVQTIVDRFLECDAHVIPGTRYYNNIMKTLRIVKRRAVGYWVTIVMIGIIYNSTPLFRSGRHLSEDLFVIYGLEPAMASPNYEISNLLMTVASIFDCFTVASTSGFVIILVGYVEANMLSLSVEIKDIWNDAVADKREKKEYQHFKNQPMKTVNMYVKRRLVNIIERHKANINLLSDVEHLFRIPIGAGFLCQSISLVAELLGGIKKTYLEIPFALIQITMDCYIGQKVMDASLIFEKAVYNCKWEKFDNSNMKLMLTILQNSQKTMRLSAGGMATMSFSCLATVLNTIYSTYTALYPKIRKNTRRN
ncbi:uncharacterized protein LOC115454899 [Manduca sexta]|uniref:uncharacterized protein LOC115454899 n=1 Tax=Manduca sexta TaxID=7130 RepID=UPI00188EB1CF|nr:uncharacterized protein LOC115454899 [Manduca sexta]